MLSDSSNHGGFCSTLAYPCAGCGATIYTSNPLPHVIMCTACLHGSAAFPFEADGASLSTYELNSANQLACHNEEVNPIPGFLYGSSSTNTYVDYHALCPTFDIENGIMTQEVNKEITKQCEEEIDSWLLLNHEDINDQPKNGVSYAGVDENLDLANLDACTQFQYQHQYNQLQSYGGLQGYHGTDSIVPVQSMEAMEQQQEQVHSFYWGLEHEAFRADFIQNPSSSWIQAPLQYTDACIVPEATTETYSYLDSVRPERTMGSSSRTAEIILPQFCPMTREAKVLKYKEKRKARKFEKIIRYSSRKANAETRRRVRGRFARRSEKELELDQTPFTTNMCTQFPHHYNN